MYIQLLFVTSLHAVGPPCVAAVVVVVSGRGGTAAAAAALQLHRSRRHQEQRTGEELQAVGEPGQTQRPAEGGAHGGEALRPRQPLGLRQGPVRVHDVETGATQGQQAWGETRCTHVKMKGSLVLSSP